MTGEVQGVGGVVNGVVMLTLDLSTVFLRLCPAVSEVARRGSSARAQQQRVHDGAGHELDDPGRHRLLLTRAQGPGAVAGKGAVPVGGGGRHGQRVHVVRQVMVAVGQLRGAVLRVFS